MKDSTKARHDMIVDAYFEVKAELSSIKGRVGGVSISMSDAVTKMEICSFIAEKIKIYSEGFIYQQLIRYITPMPREEYNRRLNEKINAATSNE